MAQNGVESALHAVLRALHVASNLCQFGRSVVFYLAKFIENFVDFAQNIWKKCQRVGVAHKRWKPLCIGFAQKFAHLLQLQAVAPDAFDGRHIEQSALHARVGKGLAQVGSLAQRQRLSIAHQPRHLVDGREQCHDGVEIAAEGETINLFASQSADAVGFEQRTHLVETKFFFDVVRIKH